MARTIATIYNSIIAAKEAKATLAGLVPNPEGYNTLLADLNNTSKVAVWRLWFYIVAVSIWAMEKVFDQHKADVEANYIARLPMTLPWYREQCFAFQYGDSLVFYQNKYQYLLIDEAKKIIKLVAVGEIEGRLQIKVAKLSGDTPEPLSAPQLAAFEFYIGKIKGPGTRTFIISEAADLLHVQLEVFINPSVMNDLGEEINSGNKTVELAINDYIKNLPFNGIFRLNHMIDKIQLVEGVVDVRVILAEAKYGSIDYTPITSKYEPFAGYLKVDPLYPLVDNITYTRA